ncbi:nitrogen regulatory protein PII [Parabacteroides sp. PF5-5]|uniref:hypothetical protein n=1 Tax=unclassified Parabacteroides TaxID=2649774 RepID=UPI002476AE2D|nr:MULTISPECIES: hypothetical protein [unclassified Parabacteroides]MDH6303706.1 nitrogen regulatory protein PII [Parabacteroides sp. PH5-39]MDH6314323.1 nitrogen regulatory protein PII [Parabacteroides sp. PF5-13]MDH6318613.1 nitrogen regulatory protein PII [Parabacteroides sp. PH5-13]MDH6322095.1 nitrogen regulatory protein PII [Parabacteroides sp. PH5-8]MDH6325826.1 nitrogen regulatory protein PII [Parabacteroides sp. PH5-41]
MKLLVVLSIKEYQERVASLLQDAGVRRFSVTDITGYKKKKESLGWFAADSSNAKTNSIMLFSFLTKEIADKAIMEIDTCNIETKNPFPVHAFILDVEHFSKLL